MTLIRIQARRGTQDQWFNDNPKLAQGELAVILDNLTGKAIGQVTGNGVDNYRDLPWMRPVKPISSAGRVGKGRDLANPSNVGFSYDFEDYGAAIDAILYPYVPPVVTISSLTVPTQEVGNTYSLPATNVVVTVANWSGVFLNGSVRQLELTINGVVSTVNLPAPSGAGDTSTYTVSVSGVFNKTSSGDVDMISARVKRSDGTFTTPVRRSITFAYKAYVFLHRFDEDLIGTLTDANLVALIKGKATQATSVWQMFDNNEPTGNYTFNLPAGFPTTQANIYAFYASGQVAFAPQSFPDNVSARADRAPVVYANGNANLNYRLTKQVSAIDGEYKAVLKSA